ncbi:MAG: type IV pilin protein [Rhodanobacteraceae bacterium]
MQEFKLMKLRLAGSGDPRRLAAGFTLLELMIVVVIIAVLSAIAIPAYDRYGYRARRADGKDQIMRMANQQERYYTANNAYDISASAQDSEKGYYNVSIASGGSSGGAQSYVITGTPQSDQADDKCGNLTYTDTGVKGWSGDESNGACW